MKSASRPGKRKRAMLGIAQLFPQTSEVPIEQLLHAGVDVLVLVANDAHQLANDLWISLTIEAVIRRSGLAKDLEKRTMNCATSSAVCPEQRTVDVEEKQNRCAPCAAH